MKLKIHKLYIIPILSFLFFLSCIFLTSSTDTLFSLIPISVLSISYCYFITKIIIQDGGLEIDIGTSALTFTYLYSLIPFLQFFLGGNSFGPLSDARLRDTYRPDSGEILEISTYYMIYLFSLGFSYILFRKPRKNLKLCNVNRPKKSLFIISLALVIAINLYFILIKYVFGIGFIDAYDLNLNSVITEGPFLMQQISGKLDLYKSVFINILLGFLVFYKRSSQYKYLLFIYLTFQVISLLLFPGSRGIVMMLIIVTALHWYKFHKLNSKILLITLLSILVLFIFIGYFRTYRYDSIGIFSELDSAINQLDTTRSNIVLSATNEFQSLFGTTFAVWKEMRFNQIPWALYLNDIIHILPPQQFLPFEKINSADWYVKQIGFEGTGVGFSWGVISQALIGLGRIELLVRGIIMGAFFSMINNIYFKYHHHFIFTIFYHGLCIASLWTMRNTSGNILSYIFDSIVPIIIILSIFKLQSGIRIKFN
tara:strand:+ start:3683 stop:5128 length:1446 start_codon:yes stop_codon:yes gene_type:complete